MPLLFLFTLFNFGGIISSFMIADYMRGLIYVAVSYFLALTIRVFCHCDPRRHGQAAADFPGLCNLLL